ncbi:tetratricopeptide repeat protein [Leptolyngbya sp. FACHB-8]|uniref:CHAT domain-containing protein n=1 Tax=unclassified Leptolyngbya TaxID=2650499 RepID=UPI0032207357
MTVSRPRDYRATEPLYQRSLSILESTLGENHPDVAISLNNLAELYRLQGNYEAAEPLYQRSLSIRESALGENHPDVATSLNNLALIYQAQGNYRAAEPLYQRSLSIYETALGENHPDVGSSLNNLASLYRVQGNYRVAEPLYQRSLSIRESALGENHPDVATTLNNLALLYRAQGNYRIAEPLYQRSLSIYESALGENHPNVALSLSNLSVLSWSQEDITAALMWMNRSAEIEETNLALMLAIGSEARKQAYLNTLAGTANRAISLHMQAAEEQPEAARLALTTLLRRKGRVLEATSDTFLALRQQLTPENQALLEELRLVETQRASAVFEDTVVDAERLRTLENRAEELQNLLAQRSAEFRAETQPATIAAVQQQIPADAALVELVRYQPYNPTASQQEQWGAPRYAAYVLQQGGEPRWVDLGEATPIDAQVFAFREALRSSQSDVQRVARSLDAQLMQPIRALVGDATHLLISPDGQLSLIPFAALMDENNQYLVKRYTFTYLSSGRELLRTRRHTTPRQGAVLVANPDFGQAQFPVAARVEGDRPATGSTRSVDFNTLTGFAPLPGTQQEAEAIVPLLPNLTLLEGSQATEERLKEVQGPSLLHIATHGFFLQDQECLAASNVRSLGDATAVIESTGDSTPCIPTPRTVENPLLRSGLVLAGVNGRSQRQGNREDGVLTAQEVAQLDLYGTQLVVLSACETGLGNVVNGEGVYGLRRAFGLAGAESQLMSLWKVDDTGTSQLMSRYYQRLMAGEGRSAALRDVQLELLNTGAYSHPYYWASFIFSGEWQPLEE